MFNFLWQGKVGEMMAPIKSPEAQLLIAIQNRQHDKVRELLEVQGVGANNANDRGVRPMHVACQAGDMALVQRLLELGSDTVTADNAGNTPLHYASKSGMMEMVKMLVGQGAAVEKRNRSGQTAYDVATDHVIRQYLLPLQLKAEAGNPEYAVHGMGITSDAPRNYEQYGVPGMGMGPSHTHGQPYGVQNGVSAGAADPMNAALSALMMPAPSMGGGPRPGAAAPGGLAPPPPPPLNTSTSQGVGGVAGNAPPPLGSFSPPDGDYNRGGLSVPPVPPLMSPSPMAPGAPSLPTPSASIQLSPTRPRPPKAFPRAATSSASAVTPTRNGGLTSPRSFPAVEVQVNNPSPTGVEQSFFGTGASNSSISGKPATGTSPPMPSGSVPNGEGGSAVIGGDVTKASPTEVVAEGEPVRSPSPAGDVDGGHQGATETRDVSKGGDAVAAAVSTATSVAPGSGVPVGAVGAGAVASVDISAKFQGLAVTSTPPPPGPPAANNPTPPPPGPPGPPAVNSPIPPPHVSAPSRRPKPSASGDQPGKPKLIKPDGFHSSASDPKLQERYGHTKIVRDMGAPPTHAQLGASYAARPPTGGPSLYGGAGYGHPEPPPPTAQYLPQPGHYQQFGAAPPAGGGGQLFAQPQQAYAPPPPLAPGISNHSVVHVAGAGAQHGSPANSNGYGGLPVPGGYTATPPAGGGTQPPPPRGGPPAGPPRGGYSVFNPTTDRVVAADSTSSAVL